MTTLISAFRVALGIGLVAALFYFRLLDVHGLAQTLGSPGLLALAALALLVTYLLGSLRWHILLQSQRLVLTLRKTTQMVLAATFFNTFLPGAYGGDLVRGTYIMRAARGRGTSALLSLLIDRLMGMSGLLTLGVVMTMLVPVHSAGVSSWALQVLAIGFVVAVILLFVSGHKVARFVRARFPQIGGRIGRILDDVSEALELYLRDWRRMIACWLLSVALFGLSVLALVIVAEIITPGHLSFLEFGIASVWGLLANSLPVTPGGIGVGEGTFAQICLGLEAVPSGAPYATVFLAYRALTILTSLSGVVAYFTYRHEVITFQTAQALEPDAK